MKPKALIGCECSGVVRDHLRAIGIDAWSCDIKPCERGSQYHIQGDIVDAIHAMQWDFIGLHPDCTAMAVSGNRWYGRGMPMHYKRIESVRWTQALWKTAKEASAKCYLENPVSVIFSEISDPVQYIQPWQFGHGETKKTGLALHGLPPLIPSRIVDGRDNRVHRMPPGPNRKTERSRTYDGIGAAIADQWGSLIFRSSI